MNLVVPGILLAAVFSLALPANADTSKPLILAVHPYLPTAEIIKRFTPLADYLTKNIGQPVKVRVGRTYAEHIDAIGNDSVDVAYMGPVSYIKLVAKYGKKPLLARQEVNHQPFLRGVLFVRQDSAVRRLEDLKGKRFAYGDPNSTMSYVIPMRMLEQAGVSESKLGHHEFLGAHKNVALAVLSGDFDAGGVKEEVFTEMAPKGLRALAFGPPVADHVFVANAKLPVALVESMRRALVQLKKAPEGQSILTSLHPGMTALLPALDVDYDSLRAITGDAVLGSP